MQTSSTSETQNYQALDQAQGQGSSSTDNAKNPKGKDFKPSNINSNRRNFFKRRDGDNTKNFIKQFGVRKMEVISSRLKSKKNGVGIGTVYVAMYLLSTMTSLETNSLPVVEPYYLSLFGHHSGLSTIGIMTNIAYAVGKPPMSKIMDVFGRPEGVFLASALCVIGAVLTFSATGMVQYGLARMAAALGSQGLQLAQMIIVADTTSLPSRGLLTSTITSPWLFTTWIGPIIGAKFASMGETGFRTIYLLFGVLVPIFSCWLGLVLSWQWRRVKLDHQRNNRTLVHTPSTSFSFQELIQESYSNSQLRGRNLIKNSFKQAWYQLDLIGSFLLAMGCGLILLPLTWSMGNNQTWFDWKRITCLISGSITIYVFKRYEESMMFPILPLRLLNQKTILYGSCLGFWHFVCQYIYESYFTSFLQVARYKSPKDAQYIQESYIFTACISAMVCGLLCKWNKRYKSWTILGIILHGIGALMMVRTRRLDNPIYEIIISQIIGGFGGGFTTLGAQLGVQSVVSHQDVGISTAMFLTITQIGGAVGSSISGSIWSWRLRSSLRKNLRGILKDDDDYAEERGGLGGSFEKKIERIVGDLVYCLNSKGELRRGIDKSYVEVQNLLNWTSLIALIPCLICGLMMENVDLEKVEEEIVKKKHQENMEDDQADQNFFRSEEGSDEESLTIGK
ncbi:major facilitator superfamily domain-containing protein [Phakopsora pachyrhizi]|uniref:Major facilitator superfamily domain-containing protein n=1 Tax=Phakopsora pachyrhizi TaxID=170000 RepID=A0AAV0BPV3_PHAPC|nr:major facilitator superfamily domain-containing protein [Phakopsora pachyrhizi]CAH7689388.1 major facilitator superfamily domain-containing protein [Phakopsora pachyrhizi]